MDKTNRESDQPDQIVLEVRKAIEHRATWMYFLLQEARQRGLDWDDFARQAVARTGALHGQLKREKMEDSGSMEQFLSLIHI